MSQCLDTSCNTPTDDENIEVPRSDDCSIAHGTMKFTIMIHFISNSRVYKQQLDWQ